MQTKQEGIVTVYDDKGALVAIVVKDEASRKNVIYNVSEAGLEDIQALLKK